MSKRWRQGILGDLKFCLIWPLFFWMGFMILPPAVPAREPVVQLRRLSPRLPTLEAAVNPKPLYDDFELRAHAFLAVPAGLQIRNSAPQRKGDVLYQL